MNELVAGLMSWAILLSGFAPPAQPPEVRRVSHDYLVKAACQGRPCKVMGWFPPGHVVYLDERLDVENNLYAASVLVHEFVHYLQQESRPAGEAFTCERAIALERQAYAAQQEYLVRYGVYQPVGLSMHNAGCELTAQH